MHSVLCETWSVDPHEAGQDGPGQPGHQDGRVAPEPSCLQPRPGLAVANRPEHRQQPVQRDPQQAVDGGRAEHHVCSDPQLGAVTLQSTVYSLHTRSQLTESDSS